MSYVQRDLHGNCQRDLYVHYLDNLMHHPLRKWIKGGELYLSIHCQYDKMHYPVHNQIKCVKHYLIIHYLMVGDDMMQMSVISESVSLPVYLLD